LKSIAVNWKVKAINNVNYISCNYLYI